jgi:hypothetical protein
VWSLGIVLDGFGNANGKLEFLLWEEIPVSAKELLEMVSAFKGPGRLQNGSLEEEFQRMIEKELDRLSVGECFRQVARKY